MLSRKLFQDARGTFSKVFFEEALSGLGSSFTVKELFWTMSTHGVIRGMHFQLPPYECEKIVWVSHGKIRDVVLDLRVDSPSFGTSVLSILDQQSGAVYVPSGCAHGYEVISESAVVNYAQSCNYVETHDGGVAWDSFGFVWTTQSPVLSERDLQLPKMKDFYSCFRLHR